MQCSVLLLPLQDTHMQGYSITMNASVAVRGFMTSLDKLRMKNVQNPVQETASKYAGED